jgi:two-component system sensor histidine kinase KdpD
MQVYRRDHAIADTWPTTDRLLVCISPSPLAARLVRATRRMAARLRAEWLVVYVETPTHLRLPETDRQRVVQTLRLAEQLGAETVTLSGQRVSEEILAYARTRNVSKIVVGKPKHPRWRDVVFGSVLDELVRSSGDIEVYVISGEPGDSKPLSTSVLQRTSSVAAYGWGVIGVALCTLLAWLVFPYLAEANLVMLYLLGIVVIAVHSGRGPALWASILSVAAFDFFFVRPYLSFHVSEAQYLLTFTVMLLVALVISTLTVRLRQQADAARQRERRTASLYAMSRDLASTQGQAHLLQVAARHIGEVFDSHVAILLPSASDGLQVWGSGEEAGETDNDRRVSATTFVPDTHEQGVAQWVYAHQQMAGLGTATLPSAGALYLPLAASRGTVGVLGLRPAQPQHLLTPEQVHWLETFASQTALALERAILADEAQHAQMQIEAERLRNTLLSTVSHDLRTPLAAIAGAASSLLEGDTVLPTATRHELLQAICDETEQLNRLVSNVLEMTRLESGAIHVAKEWQPLEEVVGAALTRLEAQLHDRPLSTHLPADLPLVPLDSVLIEQVLINLLDNALKYTPPGSPLALSAWVTDDTVTVEVADCGPGVPPGEELRLFDKLYRGQTTGARHGFGLGLTICRGIIAAHGGRIWAENRPGGGAALRFTLPLHGPPLPVLPEPEIPSDLSPDLGDHAALPMLGT